ncbi:MAG: proline--tRNA ligase, partial [Patescibacteria group bacterium]
MRQSKLFGQTLREAPKDAEAISHIYLARGGFIRQLSSGLFSFLPLGFRVLKNIEKVIREEFDKIGAQELVMPVIHPAEIWKKTGRYHEIGEELWRIKSQGGQELVLSMTHEEA